VAQYQNPEAVCVVTGADKLWHVEMVDRVAVLTYASPPMNYMTGTGISQFGRALDEARRLDPIALIITGGVPDQFITHYSVEEILAGQAMILERGPLGIHRIQLMLERLADFPLPVIAAMSGDTMGFGLELALACDFRLAQSGDFRIGLPEVRLGIVPGASGVQRMIRTLGSAATVDLVMRARLLTPDEALAHGLVHEVAADARSAALMLAGELAALPPVAVAMAKTAIYGGRDLDMTAAQRVDRDAFYRAAVSPGATDAMAEFVALRLADRRSWLDRRERRDPSPTPPEDR
jgi:enoyl-CoA hydratase